MIRPIPKIAKNLKDIWAQAGLEKPIKNSKPKQPARKAKAKRKAKK